jgi:S-formylglutathione hydrolase FrmB
LRRFATIILAASLPPGAFAAGLSGTWRAEFDSPVGRQKYVFTLQVEGNAITGRADGEFLNESHATTLAEGRLEERFQTLFQEAETNDKFRVPFYMAQGETDIALRNGQSVMAVLNRHGLRNFWVLSSGGHEWANWRRYLHQTAQIMFPDDK